MGFRTNARQSDLSDILPEEIEVSSLQFAILQHAANSGF
jgi:hypothetical protein